LEEITIKGVLTGDQIVSQSHPIFAKIVLPAAFPNQSTEERSGFVLFRGRKKCIHGT